MVDGEWCGGVKEGRGVVVVMRSKLEMKKCVEDKLCW